MEGVIINVESHLTTVERMMANVLIILLWYLGFL